MVVVTLSGLATATCRGFVTVVSGCGGGLDHPLTLGTESGDLIVIGSQRAPVIAHGRRDPVTGAGTGDTDASHDGRGPSWDRARPESQLVHADLAEDQQRQIDEARSARAMAERVGLTAARMADLVQFLDLTPAQVRTVVTSRDLPVWKAAAGVAPLYLEPPGDAVVWSVDEGNAVGPAGGVVYSALDVHGHSVAAWVTDVSAASFVDFLERLELAARPDADIVFIVDDRPSHTDAAVLDFLDGHPRIGLYLVPRTAPWLNQAYITVHPVLDQSLADGGQIESRADLTSVVLGLLEDHKRDVSQALVANTEVIAQTRALRLRQTTDHAWMAMAVALVLAVLFAGIRLVGLGGNPSTFVVASANNIPGIPPPSLQFSLTGYDGENYYLLALDPAIHTQHLDGLGLDLPAYREQRIVYPVLAWVLSGGGHPVALSWALIFINLAAMGALAFMGGLLAREADLHALWGLALPAFPAFTLVLARDLSEALAAAFLTAGLVFLRRRQVAATSVALVLAVLTKETTAFVLGGLAIVWLVEFVIRRRTALPLRATTRLTDMRLSWLTFVVPAVALGAWELFLRLWWQSAPIPAGHLAVGAPLAGLSAAAHQAFQSVTASPVVHQVVGGGDVDTAGVPSGSDKLLYAVSLVLIALAAVSVIVEMRSSSARIHEKVALAAGILAVAVLSGIFWSDDRAFLRSLSPIWVVAFLVLIGSKRRWIKFPPFLTAGGLSIGFALAALSYP